MQFSMVMLLQLFEIQDDLNFKWDIKASYTSYNFENSML